MFPHQVQTHLCSAIVLVLACAGCSNSPRNDVSDNQNSNGNVQPDEPGAGPQASPRADGATLLFSAYSTSTPEASAQNVAFSPDGGRVVFTLFLSGYNSGPAELWVANADGTDAQRISPVEDQDNVSVPGGAWNAGRDEIVFASDREDADDIWAIPPDGSGLRRVTQHTAPPYWIEPVWSPDGEWIVFEADTEADTELQQRGTIMKVRSDGTGMTQLTRRDNEDYDDRLPNWSPDGERILFQRRDPGILEGDNWDVYTIDPDGDAVTNISDAAQYFNTDNSWSPDSRWIASSSVLPTDGERLLVPNIIGFFAPIPGTGGDGAMPVRITSDDEHEDDAPSVSPDGLCVAFESHRGADGDETSPSDLWIIAVPPELATWH